MTPLFAHLMETGFGGFYDGIAHLLITPADLLLVLGLSLLSGQQGQAGGRMLLLVLPLSWWLGGCLGQVLAVGGSLETISILWFTAIGGLVALQCRVQPRWLAVLSAFSGLLFGIGNGSTMALKGAWSLDLLGVVSALTVISALVSAQTSVSRREWVRISLRVVGSWIAAAGLLTFGLQFRG